MKMQQFKQNSQSGITMIIAIILLASVTFISFAMSTVILREIQAARLVLRSEPAISGANSGGELALYRLQRYSGGLSTGGSLPESNANYQITPDLYDNIYNYSLTSTSTLQVALYDAEAIGNLTPGYKSVTINNTGGQPVRVQIYSWSAPGTNFCNFPSVTAGNSVTCDGLNSGVDQRYIALIQRLGGTTSTGQVTATDVSGNTKGIPSDTPEITVTGSSGKVERRIQIRFPN